MPGVTNALKFYKGLYGKGSNLNLPNEPKAIIFNEDEGMIYVGGKAYGGASDVTFSAGVLTIHYNDGRQDVSLDFNDTASASATFAVFERINNLIGENVNIANSDGKLNYENTNYISEAETLVEADRRLDAAIKGVDERVDGVIQDIISLDTFDTVVAHDAGTTPNNVQWNDGDSVITGSLLPSVETMHKIYLVPDQSTGGETTGTYHEYITVKDFGSDSEPDFYWELVGSTKADLTGFVKTINMNGKDYVVGDNTTKITLGTDVVTGIFGESNTDLNNTSFVNVKATTTKDTTLGTNVTSLVTSLKVVPLSEATNENNGLVTSLDVKNKINSLGTDISCMDDNNTLLLNLKQENGVVTELGVDVVYAGVSLGSDDVEIENRNGVVLGSDIEELITYIDSKSNIAKTTLTNSNGDSDAISITEMTNINGSTNYDVNLVWSEW